jgi:hypothetical protein
MLYTNIKLYGNEYIDNENQYSYFDLLLQEPHILVHTWKNLVFNKNSNKTNLVKIKRYENMLWRTWHMKQTNKNKIKFNTDINYINILKGPILIMS